MPAEVLTRIQSALVDKPERGAVVKGTHGVRKARVADPKSAQGKRGVQADLSSDQTPIIGTLSQQIRRECES